MTDERDVETIYSLSEFIAELRRLADALEAGETFTVDVDGEEVSIPADAMFSIEYEQEDGRAEIEFQVSWDIDETDEDEDGEDDEEAEDDEEETSRAGA
ncbi:Amphi-Trp domain-containing protein [Hyphomicrobiales bacterium]|nr:Amphi-Trp domain-containing protein [Hyphomicrobiales bacterium]CAH1668219.1 Amphi-Trp domain-containing protein [Hyphomicrobiales bacterium]